MGSGVVSSPPPVPDGGEVITVRTDFKQELDGRVTWTIRGVNEHDKQVWIGQIANMPPDVVRQLHDDLHEWVVERYER